MAALASITIAHARKIYKTYENIVRFRFCFAQQEVIWANRKNSDGPSSKVIVSLRVEYFYLKLHRLIEISLRLHTTDLGSSRIPFTLTPHLKRFGRFAPLKMFIFHVLDGIGTTKMASQHRAS